MTTIGEVKSAGEVVGCSEEVYRSVRNGMHPLGKAYFKTCLDAGAAPHRPALSDADQRSWKETRQQEASLLYMVRQTLKRRLSRPQYSISHKVFI